MITSNLELIPGKRIVEHLGIVQGSTVRAKHAGKDLFARKNRLMLDIADDIGGRDGGRPRHGRLSRVS